MSISNNHGKDPVAELLAEFIDRKQAGESIHPQEILERCPPESREDLRRAISFAGRFEDFPEFNLSRIGDYEIGREIGRGGMGAVFEARQISLDRRVALKVLSPAVSRDERALARFRREAQAAASLQHPHIVSVYGIGEESGFLFYSMELVEGRSLDLLIEAWKRGAKRWTPEETARVFAPLAEALDFAHRHGVVHRDIKPGNILQSRDGRLRLTDFGLARSTAQQGGLTLTGDVLGTPSYMAPEQIRGDRGIIGPRSDVFSLGATLFEVLTLDRAFQGNTPAQVLETIVTRPPKKLRSIDPRLPRELETIVSKCLQKEPGERYASAADLARDLRRFSEGKPVGAKLPGAWERTTRFIKRHPVAILTSALVFAALWAVVLFAGSYAAMGIAAVLLIGLATATGILFERSRKVTEEQEKNEYDRLLKDGITKRLSLPVFGGGYGIEMLEEMEGLYNRCIELDPKRPEAFFHRAHIWDVKKRPDLVEADLDRAIALDPRFVPAYVEKALQRLRSGKLDEAQNALNPVRELGLGEEAGILFAAFQAQEQFRFAEAAQGFSQLIERHFVPYPEADYEFRLRRGTARSLAGDHEGAKEDLLLLQGRWGEKPELQGLMARIYLQSDHFKKFLDTIEKGPLGRLPVSLFNSLRSTCLSMGREKELIDWIELQLSLHPFSKRLLYWKMAALSQMNEGGTTLHLMWKEVEGDPKDGITRSLLAYALTLQERWRHATYQSQVAVSYGQSIASAFGNQSYIFYFAGLCELGAEAGLKAIARDPHMALTYVNRSANLFRLEKFAEALLSVREALRVDPFLVVAWENLVSILLELGEFEESLRTCEEFLVVTPNCQESFYWLGLTFAALGNEKGAWDCVEKGEKKVPQPLFSRIEYLKAVLLTMRGDFKEALTSLRGHLAGPITQIRIHSNDIRREKAFHPLHGHPEFEALLTELEKREAWRKQEALLGIEAAKRDIERWKRAGCTSTELFLFGKDSPNPIDSPS